MQLYGDVISERYKHKIQFLPIPVENEHFTNKNMAQFKAHAHQQHHHQNFQFTDETHLEQKKERSDK